MFLVIAFSGVATSIIVYRSLPYIKFAYPTAKAEAIGNPFIEEKILNQILESKTLESFKNSVNSFKDFEINGRDAEEIQISLDSHLLTSIERLREESPKGLRNFYDRFIEFLDIYNIKTFIKSKIMNVDVKVTFISERFKKIADALESCEKEDMPSVFSRFNLDINLDDSPLDIDNKIDKYAISRLKEVDVPKIAKETKEEFVHVLMDVINIRNVIKGKIEEIDSETLKRTFVGEGKEISRWRFNNMCDSKDLDELISNLEGTTYHDIVKHGYDESRKRDNLQILENSTDRILLITSKNLSIKNFPFFGPLLNFVIRRYFEIKNLKIIAKGIENKLSKDRIKSLLIIGG